MPTNIPGSSASYPANVVAPADSDPRNAASVQTPLTNLADRTAWLKANAFQFIVQFGDSDLGTISRLMSLGFSPTASNGRFLVPAAGKLSMLRVSAGSSFAGSGSGMMFSLSKNGSPVEGGPVCTLSPGDTSDVDSVNTYAVAAGDVIGVFSGVSGTITTSAKNVCVTMLLTFD